MNKTVNEFNQSKAKASALLVKLSEFLTMGEAAGAGIDDNLTYKLQHALATVETGKLKIALIGGFSEGKTSIAAAWMEKLDTESMNISHLESSDMVKTYQLDDDCELIDTPGLFGFKEKLNASNDQIQKFKEITKQYVSEAHLVLYVMNSTNPIKESHHEDLKWLLRDLNLLSRTVFVLSRFDEVADVEDEWDYRQNVKIKQQNVQQRLTDAIGLTTDEMVDLAIVAVAANPFDMGTEYWLEHPDKFKNLSHIDKLQQATFEKVRINGGQMSVALEAQHSVIRDVLQRQLPKAIENDEKIGDELARLKVINSRVNKQINALDVQIIEVQRGLREFITSYFSSLILKVKGTDMNTFSQFFEREVGNEGVILNSRIQNEFEGQISTLSGELVQLQANISNEVQHYNDTVGRMGKHGLNYVVKGNFINNKSILLARDGLVGAGKLVGVDLAGMLKFKPWGAINMAKGINGALVFVGVALEAWNSYNEHKQQQAFQQALTDMVDNFEGQRKELLNIINGDNFIVSFFPQKTELNHSIAELNQCINTLEEKRSKLHAWRERGEIIEAEFTELSHA
ncbi:LeoA/HP0731 family dynamin-like GTPase [Shewanella glacialipiscicola]|uniref:LeoA/HP0731 family dynamin-like GTPase n=1 Tax=Shewanella glacialipiscicola TaxID=614069 RepID=UPI003D7BE914